MAEQDIPLQNTSKVIAVTQDYLIFGKSTKDTELRVNFHADNYEESRERIENAFRLQAYGEALKNGTLPIPPYQKKEPQKPRMADEDGRNSNNS